MKHLIRYFYALSALLLYSSGAWADSAVNVITRVDGVATTSGGQVTAEVVEGICKLTAQPAAGYFITVDDIKVMKLVTGGQAQARRRAPALAEPIELTAVDVDDPSGTTTYQFIMPGEAYDVEVTADFQHCFSMEDATVTVSGTFTYTGSACCPEVSVTIGNTVLVADKDYTVSYSNNVNAATQDAEAAPTVTVTGKGLYTGEKNAYFTIAKATPTITFIEETIRISNTPGVYHAAGFTLMLDGKPVSREDMKYNWESSDEKILTFDEHDWLVGVGVGDVVVTVTGPIDDPNFEPASASIRVTVYTDYGLNVAGINVTNENRTDVMGDGGSVQYDGSSILLFTNAKLKNGISTTIPNLTICLSGANSIIVPGQVIVFRTEEAAKLTFTTEGNDPGTLELKDELEASESAVIQGYGDVKVFFNQNLAVLEGSIKSYRAFIGTAVAPFVDDPDEGKTADMGQALGQDLSNTVIDNVLYTLKPVEHESQDNSIILTSTMVDSDMAGIITNNKPGTESFAEQFAGLTIMVPAGTGKIELTAKTGADGVLCVRIGSDEPLTFKGMMDYEPIVIPYACPTATYVYIYNGSEVVNLAAAYRAGKKTTITVGIRSVGVTADYTQSSNMAANVSAGAVPLSSDDVVFRPAGSSPSGGTANASPSITVSKAAANTLPEGLFSAYGYVSFIDLRETSLADIEVNRTEGPFKDVSPNTFIFMPAGNTSASNEPNVVIGSICNLAVLDGNMPEGESFEIAGEFTAQKVVLDRQFTKDEVTTLYLPFGIDQQAAATFGVFYTYDRIENGYVKVNAAEDGLVAHTPALFKPAADDVQIVGRVAKITLPEAPAPARRMEEEADAVEADGLYGSYAHCKATDGAFRLLPTTDFAELSFVRMTANEETLPFQCYLRANGLDGDVLKVTDDEGVVTALRGVHTVTVEDGEWHTVSGLRISKPMAKGLYIYKGQKYVIR